MGRRSGFNKRQKDGGAGLAGGASNATRGFSSGETYSGGGTNYYANSVPIGYWTFESGSDGVVHDVSSAGNNLDGTRRSTFGDARPSFDSSTKILGASSMKFIHSSDDAVTVPDNNALDFSTDDPFTLSAWIKRGGNTPSQFGGIIVKSAQTSFGGVDSPFEGYALWFNDTQQRKPAFYLYRNISGIEQLRIAADDFQMTNTDTDWHNIVVTYNGNSNLSGVKMYFDGSSIDISLTATDTLDPGDDITTSTDLCFAGFINNTGNNSRLYSFDGNMDEIAIWNKALSADEVAASYNSGAGVDLTNGIPDD